MKGCKKPRGFTIVEVMIVLAVSGLLFVSAALMVSGQQNKTGFKTAINDFQTEMQQIANEVINGYYPKFSDYTCTQNNNASPTIKSGVTGTGQGTNESLNGSTGVLSGCVFLGEAVQFAVGSTSSSLIDWYPVVGNLGDSNNLPVQSLDSAMPELLAPGAITNPNFSPEFIETYSLQYGLQIAWMCYGGGGSCSDNGIGAVVFATSPTTTGGGGSLSSGAQELEYIPILNTSLGMSSKNMVDAIDGYLVPPPETGYIVDPAGGVEICVEDQTTNQSGLLTIGGNNEQPNINLQVYIASKQCS